jgi:glutamate synthase (NADPH/NADH) large chain
MAMVELEPIPEEENAAAAGGAGELEAHGKVQIDHVAGHDDATLKGLIQRHLLYTGSERARRVLENWAAYLPKFVKVMPLEYRRALSEMAQEMAKHEKVTARTEVRAND